MVEITQNIVIPDAPVASGATYCFGDTLLDITATGLAGSNFTWYSDASLTTIVDTDDTFTPSGTLGTESVYVTQTSINGCESIPTQVDVIVNSLPAAPVTTNLPYCIGDTAVAISTAVTASGVLNWYNDEEGVTSITEPTIDTSSASVTTYYVTQTNSNNC